MPVSGGGSIHYLPETPARRGFQPIFKLQSSRGNGVWPSPAALIQGLIFSVRMFALYFVYGIRIFQ
jgi:hypothetical protein